MQTFLPYPSFSESARCLDRVRLGNQRNEARIISRYLNRSDGWGRHPAMKMWRGFSTALAWYGDAIIWEWVSRGYKNSMPLLSDYTVEENVLIPANPVTLPPWLGDEPFHASHRSNLLRKDPDWYSQFNWKETETLGYVWPSTGEI